MGVKNQESSCARKKIVDIDILTKSRNGDRKTSDESLPK